MEGGDLGFSLTLVVGDMPDRLKRFDISTLAAVWAGLVRIAGGFLAHDKCLLDQTLN